MRNALDSEREFRMAIGVVVYVKDERSGKSNGWNCALKTGGRAR